MNVFVKPRLIDDKPALVRDPASGKPLAEGGEWKTKSQFWVRRIMQGDVIDCTDEQAAAQAAMATAATAKQSASVAEAAAAAAEKNAAAAEAAATAQSGKGRGNPTSAA